MNTQIEEISKDLNVMLNLLGLQGEIKKIQEDYKFITIKLFSKEPGRLIGKRGSSLDSLSLLLNNMLYNRKKKSGTRIIIDIESDGERKKMPPKEKEAPSSNKVIDNSEVINQDETQFLDESILTNSHKQDCIDNTNIDADTTTIKKIINDNIIISKPKASTPIEKEEPKLTRTQMQCRNAIKEVKRWGEPTKIANIKEDEFKEIEEYFADEKEIKITYQKEDGSTKGRVLLELAQG